MTPEHDSDIDDLLDQLHTQQSIQLNRADVDGSSRLWRRKVRAAAAQRGLAVTVRRGTGGFVVVTVVQTLSREQIRAALHPEHPSHHHNRRHLHVVPNPSTATDGTP
jgi:hypothetical protein